MFDTKAWRMWSRAMGEELGTDQKEIDTITLIRSSIVVFNLIVGVVIVANTAHHW